jgi:hypothetical protein
LDETEEPKTLKIEILASLFAKMLENLQHFTQLIPKSRSCTLHSTLENLNERNEHSSSLTRSDPNVLRSLAKELQDWPVSLNFGSVPQFIRIYGFANLFLFIFREVTQ